MISPKSRLGSKSVSHFRLANTIASAPSTEASPESLRHRGACSPVLKQANAISGTHDAGFETSKPSRGVVA